MVANLFPQHATGRCEESPNPRGALVRMLESDPYRMPAGPELDQMVHQEVLHQNGTPCPPYSSDEEVARKVLAKLKAADLHVVVGETYVRGRKWFARYETNPSDGTEVWGETPALAICRLALLHARRGG